MTTTLVRQVTVDSTAVRSLDLNEAWAIRERGRDGWPKEPAITAELVAAVCGVVGEVAAGLDTDEIQRAELTMATLYGMGRVGEVIDEQLRLAGPRWLDPESFGYYSPHSLLSAAALAHGLAGPATTLTGRNAGGQALRHAVRRLTAAARRGGAHGGDTSRPPAALVGGYEAMTAFAVAALGRLGTAVPPRQGDVAAVLLRASGDGRRLTMIHRRDGGSRDFRASLDVVLSAANVGPEQVGTVWAPTGVDDAAWTGLTRSLSAATRRTWSGSPAVEPLRALARAVNEPTASLLVMPTPHATTLAFLS